MRKYLQRLGRPSPAMIVALVALFAALGGTGVAASTLLVSEPEPGTDTASSDEASVNRGGKRGPKGPRGKRGKTATRGPIRAAGSSGPQGGYRRDRSQGQTGLAGQPGAPAVSQYAEFFALMPPDNAATVGVGARSAYPQDGPEQGGHRAEMGAPTSASSRRREPRVPLLGARHRSGDELQLSLNGAPRSPARSSAEQPGPARRRLTLAGHNQGCQTPSCSASTRWHLNRR